MKQFKAIMIKNRLWVSVYVLAGIALAFLNNFLADYSQTLIDRFSAGTLSLGVIVFYGAVLLIQCVGNYLDEYPGRKLEHGIYLDLKLAALEKTSRIDFLAYQQLSLGRLLQQIETGSAAGRDIFLGFYLETIRSLLPSMLFGLYFIFCQSRSIALSVLAGYFIVFAVTRLLLKTLYRWKEKILTGEESFHHYLTRGLTEMVMFRLNRRFRFEIDKAAQARDQIVSGKIKTTLIHEAFFTIFAILVTLIKTGVLVYAWKTGAISTGAAIALMALVDHAYTPIAIFNVLFVGYKLNRTAFDRYARFLDEKEDEQLFSGAPTPRLRGELEAQALHFDYGTRSVLRGVSVKVAAGETVALVGPSGCGKTTLIRLFAGLLKAQNGQIRVDGIPLQTLALDGYYAHLTYVPQESPVFDGTLRENIVFDAPVQDEQILAALDCVCLGNWVRSLPQGLWTRLGARGMTLSGGERQRLALARLWFSKNEIVLLDEATSALDARTERLVLHRVREQIQGHTLIVIAHRLKAIQDFDRIVVFDKGVVAAQGCYEELLHKDALFTGLVKAEEKSDVD